ncbi:MAG: hypothetical protein HYV40_02975 [Candidatus Levybacteria bacterium]|nr:hypothetical protein [Candidatus Levybacteria bacterium]
MSEFRKPGTHDQNSANVAVIFKKKSALISFDHEPGFPTRIGGEVTPSTRTTFVVKHGEPVYLGLINIHRENPTILPRLIAGIKEFREQAVIFPAQDVLLWTAILGIEDIIEGRDDRPPGEVWGIEV